MNEEEVEAGLSETPGYRYAKRVGAQLHIAGQVPMNSEGELVGTDPHSQVKACLANLERLLRCHEFVENDIQRLTLYVVGTQATLSEAWRAVREHFFDKVPPATLIGVAALGYKGQIVEIDAIIVRESNCE